MMSLKHPAKAEALGIRMGKGSSRQAPNESRQEIDVPQ